MINRTNQSSGRNWIIVLFITSTILKHEKLTLKGLGAAWKNFSNFFLNFKNSSKLSSQVEKYHFTATNMVHVSAEGTEAFGKEACWQQGQKFERRNPLRKEPLIKKLLSRKKRGLWNRSLSARSLSVTEPEALEEEVLELWFWIISRRERSICSESYLRKYNGFHLRTIEEDRL